MLVNSSEEKASDCRALSIVLFDDLLLTKDSPRALTDRLAKDCRLSSSAIASSQLSGGQRPNLENSIFIRIIINFEGWVGMATVGVASAGLRG